VNYFDTSALIKLFVEETGSHVVSELVSESPSVATAKIAYAEVYSGLARKYRAGELSGPQYERTRGLFEAEWPAYIRVDLRDDVLALAKDLAARHPLRGVDAVHLASALSIGKALTEPVRFVAADDRLLRAARAERMALLDVRAEARP
jgi:uncharacterized protein